MWGSLAVSNGHGDLVDILVKHPLLDGDYQEAGTLLKSSIRSFTKEESVRQLPFPPTGDGWLKAYTGKDASTLVKQLKKSRRFQKSIKSEIDELVDTIRLIKEQEVQATLDAIPWADDRQDVIRSLGLEDRDLKSLRLFHTARETSLTKACDMWEDAEASLKMLDDFDDVWGQEEQNAWVSAMQLKKDARKVWKSTLHQLDKLSGKQMQILDIVRKELADKGPMDTRTIIENNPSLQGRQGTTPTQLSQLIKMYGEEMNIIKGARDTNRGEQRYVLVKSEGLVLKDADIWGYSAGFLDADGSIYITDRGEPRASFIATGSRGRLHCEHLHKVLECGKLQLDQKVYKDGQRSQHRVSFTSKDDLRKLLNGVLPHLCMKENQARAVLQYIDESDITRKEQLKKVVQYLNWDETPKSESLLDKWGIDKDTIGKWVEAL
mgnify:CR=1 FL=1|tara:strand:+ start:1337 stop:2641 length:1305 start_codon:yes stop_codon:yes gene_type:complete